MECEVCSNEAVPPIVRGIGYCSDCWDLDELHNTRCFTFAAVYDATGFRLCVGQSKIGECCAERDALWKLPLDACSIPKTVVVARVRRNRNNRRMTFGNSKPCTQCMHAFGLYNVTRVCFSTGVDTFEWADVAALQNTYTSANKRVVVL